MLKIDACAYDTPRKSVWPTRRVTRHNGLFAPIHQCARKLLP